MVDSIGSGGAPKALPLFAALGLLAAGPSAARAELMRYQFSGQTSADGSSAPVPFSGTVAYDPTEATTMTTTAPGSKSTGFGNDWNVPGTTPDASGMTLNVGGNAVISETGGLGVAVSQPTGAAQPSSALSLTSTLGQPIQATLTFSNPGQAVFSSLDPPASIDPTAFSGISLQVYGNNTSGGASSQSLLYSGQVTSFSAVPAPEPSTIALLALGAAAFGLRARSVRRRP